MFLRQSICQENGMKALFLSDEINQFHWSMLKSVLLILSLLPLSQLFLSVWQDLDASSQIVMGFIGVSVFSALSIVSFFNALHATVSKFDFDELSSSDILLIKMYRYVPMLVLAGMLSYLATLL